MGFPEFFTILKTRLAPHSAAYPPKGDCLELDTNL